MPGKRPKGERVRAKPPPPPVEPAAVAQSTDQISMVGAAYCSRSPPSASAVASAKQRAALSEFEASNEAKFQSWDRENRAQVPACRPPPVSADERMAAIRRRLNEPASATQ